MQNFKSNNFAVSILKHTGVLTCLETVISSKLSYPKGLCFLSVLSNVIVTVAFVTPACPPLYTSSCKLLARTYSMCKADNVNFCGKKFLERFKIISRFAGMGKETSMFIPHLLFCKVILWGWDF